MRFPFRPLFHVLKNVPNGARKIFLILVTGMLLYVYFDCLREDTRKRHDDAKLQFKLLNQDNGNCNATAYLIARTLAEMESLVVVGGWDWEV